MTSKNALPSRVPFSATPPGETPEISAWAQHIVWTDRMLSTLLENKVRGGKWHTLIDKVCSPRQERWPNDYFAKAGLFSLREAHNRFGQSRQGHC